MPGCHQQILMSRVHVNVFNASAIIELMRFINFVEELANVIIVIVQLGQVGINLENEN